MRAFEGEWRYITGQDTIKVYLRANNFYSLPDNTVFSELIGWHEYKIGNNIIQSDFGHQFDMLPYNFALKGQITSSIGISGGMQNAECNSTLTLLYVAMRDYNKNNRSQRWIITRVSQSTINVQQIQGECYSTASNPCITGFTLPEVFLLTKQ